jgi:ribonuclease HI
MNYLHEDKTIPKARAFSEFLNKSDYHSVIDLDSTRDYLAKIDVHFAGQYLGKLNLYYSPKKDTYKVTCQQISVDSYKDILESLWKDFLSQAAHPVPSGVVIAYVDGSFMNKTIGYGAVILKDSVIIHEISGKMDSKYNAHFQIGGELKAVVETVSWCNKQGIKDLHIYYDYKGIEMWAKAKWKANKELTQSYQTFMLKQSITIHFHKVAAHSGDKWNEYADELAKNGSRS